MFANYKQVVNDNDADLIFSQGAYATGDEFLRFVNVNDKILSSKLFECSQNIELNNATLKFRYNVIPNSSALSYNDADILPKIAIINLINTTVIPASFTTITGSLSNSNIVDNTISGLKITDSSLIGSKLSDNTVDGVKLITNSVNANRITDNTLTISKIQNLGGTPSSLTFLRGDGQWQGISQLSNGITSIQIAAEGQLNIISPNNTYQSSVGFYIVGGTSQGAKIQYSENTLLLTTTVNNQLVVIASENNMRFQKDVIINSPAVLKNNLGTVVATDNAEYVTLYHLNNSFILNGTNISTGSIPHSKLASGGSVEDDAYLSKNFGFLDPIYIRDTTKRVKMSGLITGNEGIFKVAYNTGLALAKTTFQLETIATGAKIFEIGNDGTNVDFKFNTINAFSILGNVTPNINITNKLTNSSVTKVASTNDEYITKYHYETQPLIGANITNSTIVATTKLSATGTKDSTTFLRGDNT